MVTSAPWAANAVAVASPMPVLAPMITTCCLSNDIFPGPPSCRDSLSLQDFTGTAVLVKLYASAMDLSSPRRPHTGRRRNEAAKEAILDAAFRLLSGTGAD